MLTNLQMVRGPKILIVMHVHVQRTGICSFLGTISHREEVTSRGWRQLKSRKSFSRLLQFQNLEFQSESDIETLSGGQP